MICISIGDRKQIPVISKTKPGMVELRLDLFEAEIENLMSEIDRETKIIATCRPGKLSDETRLRLLKRTVDLGAAFVDIEFEADDSYRKELLSYCKQKNTEIIISYHDFMGTPSRLDLEGILEESYTRGADIAKIACMVKKEIDNANLLSVYTLEGRKVVLGMGEKGKITRLAALYLGAEFTFASTDTGLSTAPGQITMDEFLALNKILHA